MQRIAGLAFSFIITALSCISLAARAEGRDPSDMYNGIYLALAGGVGMMTGDYETGGTADFVDDSTATRYFHTMTFSQQVTDDALGIAGRASIGYGGCIGECWYAGGELSVLGMSSNEVKGNVEQTEVLDNTGGFIDAITATHDVTANIGVEGALDFKTGAFLSDEFLLYARLGISLASVTLKSHMKLVPETAAVNGSTDQELTQDETSLGLRIGAGVEQRIGKQTALFFEYTFTDYGKFSIAQEAETYDSSFNGQAGSGVMQSKTKVSLTQQMALIGLAYHF